MNNVWLCEAGGGRTLLLLPCILQAESKIRSFDKAVCVLPHKAYRKLCSFQYQYI